MKQNTSNWKQKMPWIAALVLGALSIVAVNKYLSIQQSKNVQQNSYILGAEKNITRGQVLTRNDLKIISVPTNALSEVNISVPGLGTSTAREETERKVLMLIGRSVSRDISANQPIFWTDLAALEKPDFTNSIPENMRAITIPVSSISSVNNLIQPGDFVDILFTSQMREEDIATTSAILLLSAQNNKNLSPDALVQGNAGAKKEVSRTEILLSRMSVLAVGMDFNRKADGEYNSGYAGITLAVTPQQGVLLTHAMQKGSLSFMLRGSKDQTASEAEGIDENNLLKKSNELKKLHEAQLKNGKAGVK
jgi:Flp pilus assembly protein CpaB